MLWPMRKRRLSGALSSQPTQPAEPTETPSVTVVTSAPASHAAHPSQSSQSSRRWRHRARVGAVPLLIVALLVSVFSLIIIPQRHHIPRPTVTLSAPNVPSNDADYKGDVVYQVMLDRFFDGNPANNDPAGDTGLYDSTKTQWKLYWGGDLQGLADKVPYIAGMGVTAIWISPPAENVHTPVYSSDWSGPQAGYHGYWARDDYRIDPHLGTWTDFDSFVSTAHQYGIKVIVDFAANHSNPNDTGEYGSIYNNGTFQAAYNNDPNGWFHHNPTITNFNDEYQSDYYTLADLADFAQENSSVDSYLKGAIDQFMSHGVDGFRMDAVKDMPGPTGGWLRTVNDNVESHGPHYMYGEWFMGGTSDPSYPRAVRFANQSGIAILNYPLDTAIRDVYGSGHTTSELDSTISQEENDFTWLNDQPVFIDNHDIPRFLSINNNNAALHEALAVNMTVPGIPIIYYGTEQYLHNDTSGGGDPYNRPMMTNFSTTTTAYQLIHSLATLRHSNPALAYGTYQQRWINNDVYIYERQFYNNVVLVAVNKSGSTNYSISGLNTNLPGGSYSDYMSGLIGGNSITVGSGGAVNTFTLNANEVSVWQFTASEAGAPEVGSVGPELAHPGDSMIIDGQGFGPSGSVTVGGVSASVQSWSAHSITVTVPSIAGGQYNVQVCASGCSNTYKADVDSSSEVPVTFTVYNAPQTNYGDNVYLTGQFYELGNWSTSSSVAIGPMLDPNNPNWFLMVSVPACYTIQFKFIVIRANGTVQWENGSNHSYTAPCSGVGSDNVTWQN